MWPVRLTEGEVVLRPLRHRDSAEWARLRAANGAWLAPWEATSPRPWVSRPPTFPEYVRDLNRQARSGSALPFAITWRGAIVGQLTVSGIVLGSLCSASVGYWVGRDAAGRGITPLAVAMASDYCWFVLGLHRIEVNIRPENAASLRVVEKLGFRDEGVRVRYLHIQGDWADHRTFALTVEEVPGGLLPRARQLPSRL
ncbi:GCN5-related protein N-acetyltransferase [Beutenbergia cavernae DSM 12333]|uniref:GCN5-related protein N-acetyltransferase n=1 Tax=Beutenbergia cavernae (strain ATCC BAA-8 / DSM 12333 / CCUG 43141 / JCM 11478 / NBRC 16432 / NCIMB 13614 / HKI 0122) TaxID=471853 RepID=C5BZJ5_BEUC1|nr:GNAT family protein [Beutenbergia cavernae]ACQ79167.1 GCN5-related protein N-acetyltransferase [Beutenbergia cavernae DSM 12333]